MALNAKQERFVAEYLAELNATQAAIKAGYSPKTAESQGSRLLSNAKIAAAVAKGKAAQLKRADLSASRVLEELRRLAFVDMRDFFDARGNMRPMRELTEEQGSALASLEVIIKNAKAGDGVTDEVHKFKVWDKTRALEMLAKHYKLLTDVIRVEDEAGLIDRLRAGRKRAAEAARK